LFVDKINIKQKSVRNWDGKLKVRYEYRKLKRDGWQPLHSGMHAKWPQGHLIAFCHFHNKLPCLNFAKPIITVVGHIHLLGAVIPTRVLYTAHAEINNAWKPS
jgi:hypothetical protein